MARTGGYRRSAVWRPCGVTPHTALQNKSVVCSGSRVTISTVMKLRWSVKRGGIIVKTYTKSTCSHTLCAITQKYLSRPGGKLYVAFIDLRKAFDSVRRDTLLNMLCSAGISNTLINAVKAIYGKVLSCVRVNGEFTDILTVLKVSCKDVCWVLPCFLL